MFFILTVPLWIGLTIWAILAIFSLAKAEALKTKLSQQTQAIGEDFALESNHDRRVRLAREAAAREAYISG
jgi:hypothetical protein